MGAFIEFGRINLRQVYHLQSRHTLHHAELLLFWRVLLQNVRSLWTRVSNLYAERTYIVFEDDRYTYKQAAERVSRLASLFYTTYGVRKGDRGRFHSIPFSREWCSPSRYLTLACHSGHRNAKPARVSHRLLGSTVDRSRRDDGQRLGDTRSVDPLHRLCRPGSPRGRRRTRRNASVQLATLQNRTARSIPTKGARRSIVRDHGRGHASLEGDEQLADLISPHFAYARPLRNQAFMHALERLPLPG